MKSYKSIAMINVANSLKTMNAKKQINIFIVDDNIIFALALKTFIENAFDNMLLKVYSFETGENCIEKFMLVKPELVILDYSLDSKSAEAANGLQILDKMKRIYSETSVIMLTSNSHIDIALDSFHHGASDYVVKTENQFIKINQSISKIFANKELAFQNEEKEKQAIESLIAGKELFFQKEESERRAVELLITNFQKAEIEKSKAALEKRNKDITDSINYAKRIQQAKLPTKEKIYASLTQSFVLFKPKDIVSGDFYYFYLPPKPTPFIDGVGSGDVFIAAADCTGHGVPGAFMSMICSEKLDAAVANSSDTSEILTHLNRGIKNSLHQTSRNDSTRDGMDIAICFIDIKNGIIKYAGANRPLWVIRKGSTEVEEIKGTKKAIGGLTDDNQNFDSHIVKLMQGDTFYIFTDGYADQFGGQLGKKLMTKQFKEILLSIQEKSMREQKKHLDNFIENWKEGIEQVDDILIIGVRM